MVHHLMVHHLIRHFLTLYGVNLVVFNGREELLQAARRRLFPQDGRGGRRRQPRADNGAPSNGRIGHFLTPYGVNLMVHHLMVRYIMVYYRTHLLTLHSVKKTLFDTT